MRNWQGWLLAAVVLIVCLAHPAAAKVEDDLEAWKTEISETEKALLRPDLSATDISDLRNRLETIRAESLKAVEDLKPQLLDIKKRVEQLKAPEEGGEEPAAIVEERKQATERLQTLEALIKQLEVVALVASQVSGRAAEQQRTQFLRKVFEPGPSILSPKFWIDGITHSNALYERVRFIVKNWFQATSETQTPYGWMFRLGLLVLVWFIFWPVRKRLQRLIGPNLANPEPTVLDRLWRAVYLPLINTFAVGLAFGLIVFLAGRFSDVLSLKFGQVAIAAMVAFLWFVFLSSASRGVLAPGAPPWRLPIMGKAQAVRINWFLTLLAGVFALHIFMRELASILFLPVEFTVMQGGILSAMVTLTLIATLLSVNRDSPGDETPAVLATAKDAGFFSWVAKIRWLFWIIAIVNIVALLGGYIALASFLSEQLITTGILFAGAYIVHLLADEALTTGLDKKLILGRFVRRTFSLGEQAVERLGLILITLTDLLLVLIVGPMIVLQWTVTWIDLKSWLTVAFFGFQVGDVTISPSSVLIALLVFVAVFVLTRFVVRWLDQRLLRRTKFDRGIRDSIRTASSYAGVILAALVAASYAGLDFTNLAIVAGALSVGIGFGLQSIVNNFVSGLILLAERPLRVGDWIVVGGEEGTVRKINVRATEIETFDKTTVIVPNSTIISSSLRNWTHRDKMGRLRVAVGVSYGSDPKKVEQVLLDIAENEPTVLRSPAPYVFFMDFGASSLDFELRCYIIDVDEMITVLSTLRYTIFERFKEEGIEIPFPQQDLHLKDMDRLERVLGEKPAARSTKQSTSARKPK